MNNLISKRNEREREREKLNERKYEAGRRKRVLNTMIRLDTVGTTGVTNTKQRRTVIRTNNTSQATKQPTLVTITEEALYLFLDRFRRENCAFESFYRLDPNSHPFFLLSFFFFSPVYSFETRSPTNQPSIEPIRFNNSTKK